MKGWRNFDFGPETKQASPKTRPKNENKPIKTAQAAKPNVKKKPFDFELRVAPQQVSDLAVHPKKVQELELWLTQNVQNKNTNTAFLLLSGPTGSGKTTTVNILCKQLNISITEWVNPVDQDFEIIRGPNQITRFLEFLTESKYASLLDCSSNNKITLVKDFPNAVIHNPEDFFTILEESYYKSRHPIVFICTDASSSSINLSHTLFPQEILDKYNITSCVFNACASTFLKNALKRALGITRQHPDLFKPVPSSIFEAILSSSMGDIRSAMNQIYIASLIGSMELPTVIETTGIKRKRNQKVTTIRGMLKDETLGLFHGLGRVLNPKRKEIGNSWRIDCDISKLVDEFSTHPGMFNSFLFENYIKYYGDIRDASKAAEILSMSQIFLEKWYDRHETLSIGLWISIMGLMISNEHRVSKWTQIRGPKKLNRCLSYNKEATHLTSTDYFYYNIIKKSDKFHTFKMEEF